MPPTDLLHLVSDRLRADVSPLGAELRNLEDADGRGLQWGGDPAVWSGRAPILFPVIGVLRGDAYRLDGRTYPMPKHGFARHATFEVVAHRASGATLRLGADAATRAAYPFEFALDVDYELDGATLRIAATIANHDDRPMPASLGFHPAFRWPLPYGRPRADHAIVFAHDEPAPIRRLDADGLLLAEPRPSPVVGNTLALRDDLFDDDALIFDGLRSRAVRYGAPGGPHLDVRFDDFATLGVWTKPGGARFICIEPWQGSADPVGFEGDLWEKPGIVAIEAGASRTFAMTITLEPARA